MFLYSPESEAINALENRLNSIQKTIDNAYKIKQPSNNILIIKEHYMTLYTQIKETLKIVYKFGQQSGNEHNVETPSLHRLFNDVRGLFRRMQRIARNNYYNRKGKLIHYYKKGTLDRFLNILKYSIQFTLRTLYDPDDEFDEISLYYELNQ